MYYKDHWIQTGEEKREGPENGCTKNPENTQSRSAQMGGDGRKSLDSIQENSQCQEAIKAENEREKKKVNQKPWGMEGKGLENYQKQNVVVL